MTLELEEQRRKRLLGDIQAFFEAKLDDDIGDLKARLVLDFFMNEIAPEVYNQALGDAQAWMQDRLQYLDGELRRERGE